jgi:hypothetical protein
MSKTRTVIAALLVLLITSGITAQTLPPISIDSANSFLTAGVRWNQGHPAGMIGITKKLSPRVHLYIGGDLAGIERSGSAQAMLSVGNIHGFELMAILGPQTETIQPDPDEPTTLTYLTGATGFVLTKNLNQQLGAWTGFEYLITDANIKQWKFGIGFFAPIRL